MSNLYIESGSHVHMIVFCTSYLVASLTSFDKIHSSTTVPKFLKSIEIQKSFFKTNNYNFGLKTDEYILIAKIINKILGGRGIRLSLIRIILRSTYGITT